jgi:hypothetical protein
MALPLCEGDACDAVAVTWDASDGGYIVSNRSERVVRVWLQTWTNLIEVTVGPRQRVFLAIVRFDTPFYANFE